jgi:hypothetical protein
VEENRHGRDLGAENMGSAMGHDYEYDEAHDLTAGPLTVTPAPHRVDAPDLNLNQDGDYGYDEAHDFGAP